MTALLITAAAIWAPGERGRDPPLLSTSLSPVRGVARVIANVILGGRSQVDYHDFVHHNGAGERDLDRRRLKKQSLHRSASYAEVLQYNS